MPAQVVIDRAGHRVRLRNIDHALHVCISTETGEQRVALYPNQWTTVSDDIYEHLKRKFYQPATFSVPDWELTANGPVSLPRKEQYQEYIIEFPEEA